MFPVNTKSVPIQSMNSGAGRLSYRGFTYTADRNGYSVYDFSGAFVHSGSVSGTINAQLQAARNWIDGQFIVNPPMIPPPSLTPPSIDPPSIEDDIGGDFDKPEGDYIPPTGPPVKPGDFDGDGTPDQFDEDNYVIVEEEGKQRIVMPGSEFATVGLVMIGFIGYLFYEAFKKGE